MRVVVDTNVILDAMAGRPPWNETAEKILLQAPYVGITLCVSVSTVTDIYYLARKHLGSHEETRGLLSLLLAAVTVIEVNEQDCINGLASEVKDYEDAVLDEVAARAGVSYIVTRNTADFKKAKNKVLQPEELAELLFN